jgi:hypothetical protein
MHSDTDFRSSSCIVIGALIDAICVVVWYAHNR